MVAFQKLEHSYDPRQQDPSYDPRQPDPSYDHTHQDPSYDPTHQDPSYDPMHQDPSYDPTHQDPSYAQGASSYAPKTSDHRQHPDKGVAGVGEARFEPGLHAHRLEHSYQLEDLVKEDGDELSKLAHSFNPDNFDEEDLKGNSNINYNFLQFLSIPNSIFFTNFIWNF